MIKSHAIIPPFALSQRKKSCDITIQLKPHLLWNIFMATFMNPRGLKKIKVKLERFHEFYTLNITTRTQGSISLISWHHFSRHEDCTGNEDQKSNIAYVDYTSSST